MGFWRRVEVSCFRTTTADAINNVRSAVLFGVPQGTVVLGPLTSTRLRLSKSISRRLATVYRRTAGGKYDRYLPSRCVSRRRRSLIAESKPAQT